ncbi:phage holin, lambda family [Pseudomonas sp. 31 R 17]|uniref:phage holin, lambda family n=1 Tax=Pseudomonas sp. 31 R 17 TaxID=1844101 RepID=UPI0009F40B1B|nr:phage holin, lambda family [Pseudomonas sp. 31 R 17]
MSNKDSSIWTAVLAWFLQYSPVVFATGLSVLISALRIIYRGGTKKAMFLESVLCGCITLAMLSGLSLFGLPQAAAAFVGGMIGLLGVDKIRNLAERFADANLSQRDGDG